MFADDMRRAVLAAPRKRLAELSAALWKAYRAELISETEAQQLAELIEARKTVSPKSVEPRRRIGSRPRSPASVERRRAWSAGGWMPPAIQARFTGGEAAALAVVLHEIARSGRCALPLRAIAGRAGICATTVRNALRVAVRLRLVAVKERRVTHNRSLPNVITITSRELALWVRTRARVETHRGWVQDSVADLQPSLSLSKPSAIASARDKASRWAGKTGGALPRPHQPASTVPVGNRMRG